MKLVDQYQAWTLPEDVVEMEQEDRAETPTVGLKDLSVVFGRDRAMVPEDVTAALVATQATELDCFDVETHIHEGTAAAEVGFLGALFKGKTEMVDAGVTHEAKKYRIATTGASRRVEVGVTVRLSVAASKLEAEMSLSIPNLAATAQLGRADTRIGIYVRGYSGALGDLMPSPADLDVENYASFLEAFKQIQARVFSEAELGHLSPTILGFDEPPSAG